MSDEKIKSRLETVHRLILGLTFNQSPLFCFHHSVTKSDVGPLNISTLDAEKYSDDSISSNDDLPMQSIFLGIGSKFSTHDLAEEGDESNSTSSTSTST
jgi:hypothetical protein